MNQTNNWLNETRKYTLAGFLFGLLFPIIAIVIKVIGSSLPFNLSSILALHANEPLLWIIDTAPLILGVFAAIAGIRQDRLVVLNQEVSQKNLELERSPPSTHRAAPAWPRS